MSTATSFSHSKPTIQVCHGNTTNHKSQWATIIGREARPRARVCQGAPLHLLPLPFQQRRYPFSIKYGSVTSSLCAAEQIPWIPLHFNYPSPQLGLFPPTRERFVRFVNSIMSSKCIEILKWKVLRLRTNCLPCNGSLLLFCLLPLRNEVVHGVSPETMHPDLSMHFTLCWHVYIQMGLERASSLCIQVLHEKLRPGWDGMWVPIPQCQPCEALLSVAGFIETALL